LRSGIIPRQETAAYPDKISFVGSFVDGYSWNIATAIIKWRILVFQLKSCDGWNSSFDSLTHVTESGNDFWPFRALIASPWWFNLFDKYSRQERPLRWAKSHISCFISDLLTTFSCHEIYESHCGAVMRWTNLNSTAWNWTQHSLTVNMSKQLARTGIW